MGTSLVWVGDNFIIILPCFFSARCVGSAMPLFLPGIFPNGAKCLVSGFFFFVVLGYHVPSNLFAARGKGGGRNQNGRQAEGGDHKRPSK